MAGGSLVTRKDEDENESRTENKATSKKKQY
jgi:hypothetical protein